MASRKNLYALAVICTLFTLMLAGPAKARAEAETDISKALDGLIVPESPAFAVLDVTPNVITRPSTPRELAVSLLNGLDPAGHAQTGLALDLDPYLLFAGGKVTLADYRASVLSRALAGFQLSLAAAKGTGTDDEALRLAAGLRWSWSLGDPRMDQELTACIDTAQQDALKAFPPQSASDTGEARAMQIETFVERRAAKCRAESARRNWNRTSIEAGAAPTWVNFPGSDVYHWDRAGVWTSLAYGFEAFESLRNNSQLIISARYRSHEYRDNARVSGNEDTYAAGLKYRFGGPEAALLLQGAYLGDKIKGGNWSHSYLYSLGGEFGISGNLSLEVSVGTTAGNGNNDETFITSQLKWALPERNITK